MHGNIDKTIHAAGRDWSEDDLLMLRILHASDQIRIEAIAGLFNVNVSTLRDVTVKNKLGIGKKVKCFGDQRGFGSDIPKHGMHRLAKQVFEIIRSNRVSMTSISVKAGFTGGAIRNWQKNTPSLKTLEAVLVVFEKQLVIADIDKTQIVKPQAIKSNEPVKVHKSRHYISNFEAA